MISELNQDASLWAMKSQCKQCKSQGQPKQVMQGIKIWLNLSLGVSGEGGGGGAQGTCAGVARIFPKVQKNLHFAPPLV